MDYEYEDYAEGEADREPVEPKPRVEHKFSLRFQDMGRLQEFSDKFGIVLDEEIKREIKNGRTPQLGYDVEANFSGSEAEMIYFALEWSDEIALRNMAKERQQKMLGKFYDEIIKAKHLEYENLKKYVATVENAVLEGI